MCNEKSGQTIENMKIVNFNAFETTLNNERNLAACREKVSGISL
jgi:hypothetical protein